MADPAVRAEAGRWLAKAARDAAAARRCREGPDPLLDMAAYHCQQAAEKAAKALLVLAGEPPWSEPTTSTRWRIAPSRASPGLRRGWTRSAT